MLVMVDGGGVVGGGGGGIGWTYTTVPAEFVIVMVPPPTLDTAKVQPGVPAW